MTLLEKAMRHPRKGRQKVVGVEADDLLLAFLRDEVGVSAVMKVLGHKSTASVYMVAASTAMRLCRQGTLEIRKVKAPKS